MDVDGVSDDSGESPTSLGPRAVGSALDGVEHPKDGESEMAVDSGTGGRDEMAMAPHLRANARLDWTQSQVEALVLPRKKHEAPNINISPQRISSSSSEPAAPAVVVNHHSQVLVGSASISMYSCSDGGYSFR
jgi:hypothetical protein